MNIPRSLRFAVLERDQFRCVYCGAVASEKSLHVDHVIPQSKGGPTLIGNLVTACHDCNLGKRDSVMQGLSVDLIAGVQIAFENAALVKSLNEWSCRKSLDDHEPGDASVEIVRQIRSPSHALSVSIAASHLPLRHIGELIGISKTYVSRLQRGERAIPSKLVKPLCAATGSNLLHQFIQLQILLDDGYGVEGLAMQLRTTA